MQVLRLPVVLVLSLFVLLCAASAGAAGAPVPPSQDFLVALTYNLGANNNSIVQLDSATGTPAFAHWWGNLVFQFTAFTFDPVNRTLILMGALLLLPLPFLFNSDHTCLCPDWLGG
jgi:hypothetical protein